MKKIAIVLAGIAVFIGAFTFSSSAMHARKNVAVVLMTEVTNVKPRLQYQFDVPNLDQIKVATDLFPSSGPANVQAATAPYISNTIFYRFHSDRIRQYGCISKIDLYFAAKPTQVTGFYFQVWRKQDGVNSWDKIASSPDLYPGAVAGQINTFNFAPSLCGIKEGDHVALYYTLNAIDPGDFLHQEGQHAYRAVYNTTPFSTGYDFTTGVNINGIPPINIYMRAPLFVAIGDSNTAGAPAHASFQEFLGTDDLEELPFSFKVSKKIGWPGQNAGISGDTTVGILARYMIDVVDIKPRFVISMIGTNDVRFGVSQATFLANYKTMLDTYVARSIKPIVLSIPPCSPSQCDNATLTKMDSYNTALQALVATYPTAKWVDVRPYIGMPRIGGPSGNYWDIKPQYSADDLHYNDAGHTAIANVIIQSFTNVYSQVEQPQPQSFAIGR